MTENSQMTDSNPLDMITDIAQRRREKAQQTLAQELPSFILEILQTEVAYTINPRALPLSQCDSSALLNSLKQKYNIRYKMPDLGMAARLHGNTLNIQISEEQALSLQLSQTSPIATFEDGRLPIARSDFTPIKSIIFNRETIHVSVVGKSQAADLIVAEVAEEIWSAAGMQRRWDDIRKYIQLITYGTGTIVELGFPFETLMNPKMLNFLDSSVLKGKNYAAGMGSLSERDQFAAPKSAISRYTLDELHLMFHRFDQVTGRSESSLLRFSVMSKDSRGTGRILVASELSFDKHIEFIGDFISIMEKSQ